MNSRSKIQQASTRMILAPRCPVKCWTQGVSDKLAWFHVTVSNCPEIIVLLPCEYPADVATELGLLVFISSSWALVAMCYWIYYTPGWWEAFLSNAVAELVLLMIYRFSCGSWDSWLWVAIQRVLVLGTERSFTLAICVQEASLLHCGSKSGMATGQ